MDDVDEMTLDAEVWAIRDAFYESLSEGKLGMFGALVARGEARGIR